MSLSFSLTHTHSHPCLPPVDPCAVCVCVLQAWLQRYGYLPPSDPRVSLLRSAQTLESGIAAMQRRYGLTVTGALDQNTIE